MTEERIKKIGSDKQQTATQKTERQHRPDDSVDGPGQDTVTQVRKKPGTDDATYRRTPKSTEPTHQKNVKGHDGEGGEGNCKLGVHSYTCLYLSTYLG